MPDRIFLGREVLSFDDAGREFETPFLRNEALDALYDLIKEFLDRLAQRVPGTIDDIAKDLLLKKIESEIVIQQLLNDAMGPSLFWRAYCEGSCADFDAITIETAQSYVKPVSAFGAGITEIPVLNGASITITVSGSVDGGPYDKYLFHCEDYPAYQAWKAEDARLKALNDKRDKTYKRWREELDAYRLRLKETGSAFLPNGDPVPTPHWPEEVENRYWPRPPAPPLGRCKERHIWVLLEASVSIVFGPFTTVVQRPIGDYYYLLRTPCCPPG